MLVLAVIVLALGADARQSYIIGGDHAEKGVWPWQISLQVFNPRYPVKDFQHTCGGSILNENWVLVAGHCTMYDTRPDQYKVKVGLYQLSAHDEAQAIDVTEIITHKGFEDMKQGLPDDISLLRLAEPINLDAEGVSSIQLASDDVIYAGNPKCFISGWGRDDRSTKNPSDILRQANVDVLTNQVCKDRYGPLWNLVMPLSEGHVCMSGNGSSDIHACHGDSGGPLQCEVDGEWHLVGVASRTGPPDCENFPSVYIRVSKYLDWIADNMQ